ncbi:MAG: NAD(P)-dependent oxidoreductase [Pseudolabrys sp.]|nr:NAD(P)-dependent oxidoreductase [Pseudolabrys sp.]
MKPTVAIVAPGNMGAGIGRCLAEHEVTVLTTLAGRSADSAQRARAAGMQTVDEQQLMQADFLLSIVPPGTALTLAQRLAAHLAGVDRKPVFVDCNAVSPATMCRIAEVITATGARFIAAGIIGPPPQSGSTNTKIYASGPHAVELARLNEYGLNVRILEGPLTAASALKMSYAGITKGFTALGAAMILAATREGSAAALKAELAESQPALFSWLLRQIPAMYGKAYRWVAELEEIAAFVGQDRDEAVMLSAAARLYERIAADGRTDKTEIDKLDRFLDRMSR